MQLVQESVFLKILGWSLFNSLWQMAVLWILYNLLSGGGKKFSSPYRHTLALILMGIGTLWFIFDLCSFKVNEVALPLIPNITFLNRSLRIPEGNLPSFLFPYFALGYLFLIMVQCARYASYYQRALYRKKAGIQKMPASLRLFVNEVAKQLGIAQRVNIWLTPWVESPLTMGLLKSIILFPLAMINQLSTKQVEALLLHELAHIKRNDYLLNLFVTMANIAFFFNPFSRALIQHIRREMENSCDDLVMQFGYEPSVYCSALLTLEKNRSPYSFALAASGRSDYLLLDRVKRITGLQSKASPNKSTNYLLLLLGLACGLIIFVSTPPKAKLDAKSHKVINIVSRTHYLSSPNSSLRINEARVLEIGAGKGNKSPETVNKMEFSEQKSNLEHYDSQVREKQSEPSVYPEMIEAAQPIPISDFSMSPAPFTERIEVPGETSAKKFPYVANSSFSFHIVEDSPVSTKE